MVAKKKLIYFYIYTCNQFNRDHWMKARKLIEKEFKLKCRSNYVGNNNYRYGNFVTYNKNKITSIEQIIKNKKLRVALAIEDLH